LLTGKEQAQADEQQYVLHDHLIVPES
jgi:hypothetical protein